MSTKALVTINLNGEPVAYLHSNYDGMPAHVGVTLLDALAGSTTPAEIAERLGSERDSVFKWTKFEAVAAKDVPRLENQFKYDLNLAAGPDGLKLESVKVHDLHRPHERSFEGTAGDYYNHVAKTVAKMPDAAFKEGAKGREGVVAAMAELDKGLITTTPARHLVPDAPAQATPSIAVTPKKTLIVGATLSPVQETIAEQVAAALRSQGHRDFSRIMFGKLPDGVSLLVQLGQRSVEIAYNKGQDLYDIKKNVTNKMTFESKTTEHKGLNAEQMSDSLKHLTSRTRIKSDVER